MSRQAVLATFGSLGDLHPFIALARALQDIGVDPVIATTLEFQDKVETAGIAFTAIRPSFADLERDTGMDRAELTRRCMQRTDFLFRRIALPHLGAAFADASAAVERADIVLTSSLAFGARLAAEKRGIPWMTVVLQPMMFFSAHDPPLLPQAPWLMPWCRRLGPRFTASIFAAGRGLTRPMFAPVDDLRASVGLAPDRAHPLFDAQFSKFGTIGLYSDVLGPVQPDFPKGTQITGFAHFDSEEGGDAALVPDLARWLDAGDAPLVFTLGSLIVNCSGDFFQHSAAIASKLNRRALLLVGEGLAGRHANLQSAGVFISAYAPHSLVFRRAAAVVHHGGIGTLAQALRAGRPQLIVPFYADQADNAVRAARLGLARIVNPSRYRVSTGARELGRLLEDADSMAAAEAVRCRLADADGAARAARIIADRMAEAATP